MFAMPKFEEQTAWFSLHFRDAELEFSFQEFKKESYLKGKFLNYLVLTTILVMLALALVRVLVPVNTPEGPSNLHTALTTAFYLFGFVSEAAIWVTERLIRLRTVALCVTIFVGSAIYNANLDPLPVFRPGYY